jgi:hypothetical protein
MSPLRVGLIVLSRGNVDRGALSSLVSRSKALEQRLAAEYARYRPGAPWMIEIVPYGPVEVTSPPPSEPGVTLWQRLGHAYALWRYTESVDELAGVPTLALDSRIYVLAEPAEHASVLRVEGFSENGGRVGVARVELDATTVDLALFVAAHELFHTLGASDKYDSAGRTLVPDGVPEPLRFPLFPQPGAEVMARNRMLSPSVEVVPDDLEQLIVGRATAREIGWLD